MKKKTNKQKQNQNKTKSTFESNTFAFGFVYAKHRDRLKKVVQKPAEIPGHKKSWANICFSVDLFFWRAYYRPGRGGGYYRKEFGVSMILGFIFWKRCRV